MTAQSTRNPRGRKARLFAALASAAVAALAVTGTASAAPAGGDVVLNLKKGAASSLLREGVKVTYDGGKAGSSAVRGKKGGANQTVKIPVADIEFAGSAKVATRGSLALSLQGSQAKLHAIVVQVANGKTAISAKLAGKRKVFFRSNSGATIGADSVTLSNGALSLTPKGAKALRAALGSDGITGGKVGTGSIGAKLFVTPIIPEPILPPPPVDPYGAQCPLPAKSVGTASATGAAAGLNLPGAPQISGAGKIGWGFKQSFRIYLATGAEGSATGIAPATVLSPPPGPPQVGTFEFPVGGGKYETNDPSDPGDDQAVIDGKGTIVMCAFHKGAGFRIALTNPTVTIDGANSRLTADVSTNITGVITPPQRVDVATIELADASYSSDPRGVKWSNLVTKLTQAGLDAMKLCSPGAPSCVYSAGMTIDPITVEFVEPWPLNAACTLTSTATTSSWPTAPASPAVLPTLPDPVLGGDIDWGLRNSLRATVNANGVFNLLDGATRSDPMNMDGAGKFFTWPATTGSYEAGTPGKLVLQGSGTVGICNSKHGYGTVLANPTLVIDGANSRLTMDVATRLGVSWTSFRVDIASLDIADVVVTTQSVGPGLEQITWTFPDPADDDTDSSVTLTEAGTKALWLLGASYRTAGISLNQVSVSAVVEP